MLLDVTVFNPTKILFQGKARNVIVPGEMGTFEILPFHKCIMSRLMKGVLYIEDHPIALQRGIVKADKNSVTIIIEEPV